MVSNLNPIIPALPTHPGQKATWGHLPGSSLSLILSSLLLEHQKPALIIAQDSLTAARLERELAYFQQNEAPTLHFPDRETLPYDRFSPHQDLISDRLATLHKTAGLQQG